MSMGSPLLDAIYDNDIDQFQNLIDSGENINGEDGRDSPLLAAADNCRPEIFDLLIKSGVKTEGSFRVLSQAIGKNCPEIYFKLVKEVGIETQDQKDRLLLNAAGVPYKGSIPLLTDLINRGANPVAVIVGEIMASTPIKNSYEANKNNYYEGAKPAYNYLLEISISRTGETKEQIFKKYVEKYSRNPEECSAC